MKRTLPFAIASCLSLTIVTAALAQGPNPPGVNPQHFECYDVIESVSLPANKVALRDQFGSSKTVTAQPVSLCNPVSKNGGKVTDSVTHLVCYAIRPPKSTVKRVAIQNQFGVDTLAVSAARTLCVPSLKNLLR
jgi:hypothetical protein